MSRDLADIIFPEHCRTSCSDNNLANADVHHDNGASRCKRCMALDNINMPLNHFEIYATILRIPTEEELERVRKRALSKLSNQEIDALRNHWA